MKFRMETCFLQTTTDVKFLKFGAALADGLKCGEVLPKDRKFRKNNLC